MATVAEINAVFGGFLIHIAGRASELAVDRAKKEAKESKHEAFTLVRDWGQGFADRVAEEKAEEALSTLAKLPPTATMAACRLLMKAAAGTAFGRYRAEVERAQEEIRVGAHGKSNQGDWEREEAGDNTSPYDAPTDFAMLEEMVERLHAELSAEYLRAQQAQYGRRTSFNQHLFSELPIGWIVEGDEPVAYYTLPEYINALERALALMEENRVEELRAARKGGLDFSAFA